MPAEIADADMLLPPGESCGNCFHFYRCRRLFGCAPTNTLCDFAPSKFERRLQPLDAARAGEKQ